ncbi:MAG: hypothetical protein AABW80_03340 [Nanoarchaeota archaeon]
MNRRKFIFSLLSIPILPSLVCGRPEINQSIPVIPTLELGDKILIENGAVVPLEINDELLIQAAEHVPNTNNISLNQLLITNQNGKWGYKWRNQLYSDRQKEIPVVPAEGLVLFNLNLLRYAGQFFTFQLKEEDTGLTILRPSGHHLLDSDGHPLSHLAINRTIMCIGWFSPGERFKKFPGSMTEKDIAGRDVRYTFKTYTGLYDVGFFPKKPYDVLEFKIKYPKVHRELFR